MIELSLQPTSEKFIASLVKSLQILCNGQVDFKESIELIGHINVKVDHEHKYNYIVDEHVTKGNNSSSTTFHSNSYHSPPPTKVLSTQPTQPGPQSQPCHNPNVSFNLGLEPTTSVANRLHTVEVSQKPANSIKRQDNVLVKSEGSENDCMVLPVSPEFEPSEVTSSKEGQILPTSAAPSGSYEVSYGTQPGNLTNLTENKRQIEQNNQENVSTQSKETKAENSKSSTRKKAASELIGKFAAYECSYCSVILTEYDDLTLHSKSCPSPSCNMICLTCGEKLPNKPDMRKHLKQVHSYKTFGCKYCDMMFLSPSGLLSHTKAKHKPDGRTLCQICGQAFHNKYNLEGHMNMHWGIRPFKCKRCGKGYGHSKSLLTHEKLCKSTINSSKNILNKNRIPNTHREHISMTKHDPKLSLHNDMSQKINTKELAQIQMSTLPSNHIASTALESTPLPSTPGPTEVSPSLMYETYQQFNNSGEKGDDDDQNERTMTIIPNSNQNFTFHSPSYQHSFNDSQSQSSLVFSALDSDNSHIPLSDPVYGHQSTSFVLPQVAYGMYQHELLPDQR